MGTAPDPTYRILHAYEHLVVGHTGHAKARKSQYTIEALQTINTITFKFATEVTGVELMDGTRVVMRSESGQYAADIPLPRQLQPHEQAPLRFVTIFNEASKPPRQFRATFTHPEMHLKMVLTFESRLPRHVWEVEWAAGKEDNAPLFGKRPVKPQGFLGANVINREVHNNHPGEYGFMWD